MYSTFANVQYTLLTLLTYLLYLPTCVLTYLLYLLTYLRTYFTYLLAYLFARLPLRLKRKNFSQSCVLHGPVGGSCTKGNWFWILFDLVFFTSFLKENLFIVSDLHWKNSFKYFPIMELKIHVDVKLCRLRQFNTTKQKTKRRETSENALQHN